ncbi:NUDIX domain-containing protein [Frankia sp. AgPm24]|uniref:NUDIX domain-containing protein n=1 Tax=Frankia sp. AgPm24 TaxID=631128 RepID=UPI00200F18D2|nr:NUDIX domain-containing protein [Frankia sp. AgPm24]MCK9920639.1 NUDIX domain-containing protein [Frankia sp. AgPm24]
MRVRDEPRSPVDVLALVLREDRLLLTLRAGEIYGADWWALPSGRVEPGEDVVSALVRELDEELALTIDEADVTFTAVTHAQPPDHEARIGFGFAVRRFTGEPTIREPDRCADLRWCPLGELPTRTMPYTGEMIRLYQQATTFSRFNWP